MPKIVTDSVTRLELPTSTAGWDLASTQGYGPKDGRGYAYSNHVFPRAFASVFLYQPFTSIPDGMSPAMAEQLSARFVSDVAYAERRGQYKVTSGITDSIEEVRLREGTVRWFAASLLIRTDGVDERTWAYYTGFRNHLLKIRVTYPCGGAEEVYRLAVKGLLQSLSRVVAKTGSSTASRAIQTPAQTPAPLSPVTRTRWKFWSRS